MSVVVCSENRRADWDDLIAHCADATSGHLWQWRDVVGSAYGFDSHYLLAQDGRGRPIAAAPFIFVRSFLYGSELSSMPYLDYGGVCHADSLDSAGRAAARCRADCSCARVGVEAARQAPAYPQPDADAAAIRSQHGESGAASGAVADDRRANAPAAVGAPQPAEANRKARARRRSRATRPMPSALADFCATYSENMRDLGSPTHGRRFFSNLVSRFRERLSLIRVRSNGRVVAAGLAMNFRGSMMLPWSGATFEARPVYATNALYWKAIQLGIESGCHTFDFGRSSVRVGHLRIQAAMGTDSGAAILEHAISFAARVGAAPAQEPANDQPPVASHAAWSGAYIRAWA